MSANNKSQSLETRLGRYVVAAGALAVGAFPTQAAPITVILPTPIDVKDSFALDMDQNGLIDFFFSGSGSTAFASYWANARVLALTGLVDQLSIGATFGQSATNWTLYATMGLGPSTGSPSFLAIQFGTSNSSLNRPRLGFVQFNGSEIYGYAWEEASSMTTFDLRTAAGEVPEPGTGALAALALGAVGYAARKRKQA